MTNHATTRQPRARYARGVDEHAGARNAARSTDDVTTTPGAVARGAGRTTARRVPAEAR